MVALQLAEDSFNSLTCGQLPLIAISGTSVKKALGFLIPQKPDETLCPSENEKDCINFTRVRICCCT